MCALVTGVQTCALPIFIGERAKVGLKLPQDGRRRLQGVITAVDGERIAFDVDGTPVEVGFDNIDKARLVPDWVALGLAPARDKSGPDAHPVKQAKTQPTDKRTKQTASVKPSTTAQETDEQGTVPGSGCSPQRKRPARARIPPGVRRGA